MRDQQLLTCTKRLRTEQTALEQKLWHARRAKRLGGAKFGRQVVIGRYIVDFAGRISEDAGDRSGWRYERRSERV